MFLSFPTFKIIYIMFFSLSIFFLLFIYLSYNLYTINIIYLHFHILSRPYIVFRPFLKVYLPFL